MRVEAVLDTNILVDYLLGVEAAAAELARWRRPAVSLVTWMEVMVGARDEEEGTVLRSFLASFQVLPVDREVAEEAVALRREVGLHLPDAIVWATARVAGAILVTRDTGDFPEDDPTIRVPYRL